ncbi:nitrous oxide reductase accessory protein NosL [Paenibacillus dakarensis]|uniref:nitrous oxide reductase accessory protein NosL n=1 Tax=Paenibacillus dakarensis TaxID=1527293 RepID=UPI0006D58A6C|nr:nitrous oxide reductase accessory protein NosL [Paenibacillus dakarensis]
MKKMWILVTLSLLVMLTAGCGGDTKFEPAAIDENADKCAVCNMQVKDDQHAVQIVLKDSKVLKFDDLGDLFKWKQNNGTDQIGAEFVRDYNTKEWIHLQEASYVYDKSIRTPMAYGVISFQKKEDAEKFVSEHGAGTVMSSSDLDSHTWESDKKMMNNKHSESGSGDHTSEEQHDKDTHE